MSTHVYVIVEKEPLNNGYSAELFCPVSGFIDGTPIRACPIDAADDAIRIACSRGLIVSGVAKGKGW